MDKVCLYDKTISFCKGCLACFEKTQLAEMVFAGGVTGVGEIKGHSALIKAYEMGKSV